MIAYRKVYLWVTILLFCFITVWVDASQENINEKYILRNFSTYYKTTSLFKRGLNLNLFCGTHRDGIGLEVAELIFKPFPYIPKFITRGIDPNAYVGIWARLGGSYYYRYFGFPGESFVLESHLKFLFSVGAENVFFTR